MKITQMIKQLGGTKTAIAKSANISPQSLNNMVRKGQEVEQLANGDYVLMNSKTVVFKGQGNE
jgi:hypothetical protein